MDGDRPVPVRGDSQLKEKCLALGIEIVVPDPPVQSDLANSTVRISVEIGYEVILPPVPNAVDPPWVETEKGHHLFIFIGEPGNAWPILRARSVDEEFLNSRLSNGIHNLGQMTFETKVLQVKMTIDHPVDRPARPGTKYFFSLPGSDASESCANAGS